ncbi:MAG: BatD family protein [Bdellovibrionales bacterium]|nr:BatD family protein [Bdellovibrionales bacterium]
MNFSFRASRFAFLLSAMCAVLLLLASSALADVRASVNISPDSGTVEDIFEMVVAVHGDPSGSAGSPKFEDSPNFSVNSLGQSSKHLFINGETTSVRTFRYQLIPSSSLKPGTYNGPKSYFEVNDNKVYLSQPKIEIVGGKAGSPSSQLDIDLTQTLSDPKPFFGEQILYEATVISKHNWRNARMSEIEYDGFWNESFGDESQISKDLPGGARMFTLRTALFPVKSGKIHVPERSLTIDLRLERPSPSRRRFDPMWGSLPDAFDRYYQTVSKRLVAEPVYADVRPLPTPPAGAQSYIPVGKVTLAASVDKKLVQLGEGITMTIDFYGNANLRPLQLPKSGIESTKDSFKVYEDEPEIERFVEKNQIFFRKKFSLALVPKKSGKLKLPTFKLAVFDPKTEQYYWLETPERVIHVTPALDQESLVISAPEITQGGTSKQQVTLLGEDLLPQHVGKQVLSPASRVSNSLFISLLLLFPALGFAGNYYGRKLAAIRSNPALAAKRLAMTTAASALNTCVKNGSADSSELLSIARKYFGDRFERRGESLTSSEIKSIISKQTNDEQLAENLAGALSQLEHSQYGAAIGLASSALTPQQLLEMLQAVEERATR